jgi:ubiquinone/menaquinone biosynthesis C-methylase UbiE
MTQSKFEQMPNFAFRMMSAVMAIEDLVHPTIDKRVLTFGIHEGITIVDYGCGPGRYATRFAKLVGKNGKVYAVDVQPLAIEMVKSKMKKQALENIAPVLAKGYNTGLPDKIADMVCALDMFFALREPTTFLREVHRIIKPDGVLIIDDGHESRQATLQKIQVSGCWRVTEESRDHLKCLPV